MRQAYHLLVTAAIALAACGRSTEDRVRELFRVPSGESVDTLTVAKAIARDFRLGLPIDSALALLDDRGVGRVPHTSYHWFKPDSVLVINVGLDPNRLEIVQAEYGIGLTFDSARRLAEISVSRGLTGP